MSVSVSSFQRRPFQRWPMLLTLMLALAAVWLPNAPVAYAASITVTTTADTIDAAANCTSVTLASLPGPDGQTSLREAVCAANSNAGADTITFSVNGTFALTGAANEDNGGTGDLDIKQSLAINGNGIANTIIDGSGTERIFDVFPSAASTFDLSNLTVQNGDTRSTSFKEGGAMYLHNNVTSTLTTVQVINNFSGANGAIENRGNLTISNSTISNNQTIPSSGSVVGGGIRNAGALSINNSTISNNSVRGEGGGIVINVANGVTASITNSTISGNTASVTGGGLGNGGGISTTGNQGTINITNSTISGNHADNNGGGAYWVTPAAGTGNVTLNNVTITNNTTDNDNNGSGAGGGFAVNTSAVTLRNTIVAGNFNSITSVRDDISGAVVASSSYNLIGDGTGSSGITNGVNNNQVGSGASPINPLLGSLGNNGGPTQTHALLAGSPAIDTANNATCAATDQRGVIRPQPTGGVCDIGAFELAVPDLTIAKSHTGNFTQGQTGAQYTITVSNNGAGATSGTVTVVDTLPTGLTATALSGTGWSCVLGTLTCTRSDALAANSSYPSIILTVSVAGNAPASVTNTATVSGGGEVVTSNDTANDPTTITQLPDLTATKTNNVGGNALVGQSWTWTVTIANGGGGNASFSSGQTILTDNLPNGASISYGSPSASNPNVSCSINASKDLSCTASSAMTLAPSGSFTVQFTAVASAPGAYANPRAGGGCSVDSGSVVAESNEGNNTCSNSVTVAKSNTTTTITSDNPDPSVVGQPVTVQFTVAAVAPGSGTPSGNVTVSDGTASCTGTVAAGQCTITFTSAGAKSLTATYAGDTNFNSSTSASVGHTVGKADTTTTITSDNPDPSVVGQPVTIQFTIAAVAPGSGTPTGNVTVSDGTQSCTGTVAAGQCTITFTSAGAKSLTATYAGDTNYNGSTSATVSHQVNKADTTTTITSDNPDPSAVGQAVTVQFTVAAVAPGSGTPTGNVTVSDGTDSCTGTVAAGSCSISFSSVGNKTLTATYAGDSNFNGSTSAGEPHTVNSAGTTTTITSDNPDPSVVGQPVTVQFSVTSGGGTPTGNVTVTDGTVSCTGTVAAGQCSLTFTSAGAKSLTASYAGDSNFGGSTSAAEPHQVDKADTTTTITSDNPDPSVVGQSVSVQYSVTANSPGAGTPSGNVTVSDGTQSCTGTVGAGSCTITFTSTGSKSLTATYAGDANYNGSTSASVSHQVAKADTTTTITSDNPDPSALGQAVTVQFTVVVVAPGGGTPTGNVTVSDGVDSCTGSVAGGSCTITLTTLGNRTLNATYAGDSNFNGSTSVGEPHTVTPAGTTTTITSDNPDPSAVGQAVTVSYNVAVSPPAIGTPTGNVTVSDGTDSCTGTVATGSCSISFSSAGNKTLTASYAGDSNFGGSTSAGEPHTVTPADTTTTITSDTPDPSVVGQAVTVQFTVAPVAPGSGTPTGNVTVSDGTDSCTATVAAGSCSISFSSVGNKSLTASYASDGNFNSSTSASAAHTVAKADTATTITSDTPDPSVIGQAVTVQFTVVAVAPGGGTPTGNVTVSDGTDSCTSTVASGSCTITLTTPGNRTLTASYAGDANFNTSTSAAEPHTVNTSGVSVTPTSVNVAEGGATATYQVALLTQPSANVTISISTDGQTTVNPTALTFTPANWNTPQTVTVTAVDDSVVEGTHTSTISHSATSADGNYNGISIPNVTASIADNDNISTFKLYLPMVMRDVPPFLPDLVVERINVTHTSIQVVIRNQGPAPVTSAFWVDVYINPNPAPTGVNQIWQDLASEGLVWGIPDAALPLAPGGTLTLDIGDSYYHPEASVFSGSLAAGTLIYAQVDSANSQTNYGGVLETHELTGGMYNNISSTTVPAAGVLLEAIPSFDRPRDDVHLPARRKGPRSTPR